MGISRFPNREAVIPHVPEGYSLEPITGTITRKVPKQPSKKALKKNTKRARKFAAYEEANK